MTTVLLVRHGESTANLNNLFAGNFDAELTERGHEQAECTARFIADAYKVEAIYASDLRRACGTAMHLGNLLQLPVYPERGMREISAGEWEGASFYHLGDTHPEEYRHWMTDIGTSRCPGGESVAEMADRVYETVCRIAAENDGKTVAIFTHATPIRSIEWRLTAKPLSYMQKIPWVSNASVSELQYDGGMLRAVHMGQDDHLSALRTALPNNV